MMATVVIALSLQVGDAHSEQSRPRNDDRNISSAPARADAAQASLAASYEVVKEWGDGFKAEITLQNTGSEPVSNWELAFDYPVAIGTMWRAKIVSQSGDRYLVSGLDYSDSIAPGESIVFGFTGKGSPDAEPVFLADIDQAPSVALVEEPAAPEPDRQSADAQSADTQSTDAQSAQPQTAPEELWQPPTEPLPDSASLALAAKPLASTQTLASMPAPDAAADATAGPVVDVEEGTDAAELQAIIDDAPAGSTIRLTEGEFEFDRTITIGRDDLTLEGAGSDRTTIVYDPESGEEGSAFAVHSAGLSEETYALARNASAGDTTLSLANGQTFRVGEFVWLERPNTEEFFEEIGDESWLKDQPLRTSIARVTAVNGNELTLENGIYFDYDTADTTVRKLDMIENVALRGFTIETALGDADPADFSNNYDEYDFIAMVDLEGTYKARLQDIAIYNSGSKAFLFKKTLAMIASDLLADGTHNKGKGGNGYAFELKEVYESQLSGLEDHGMRHSVIFASWYSAANNIVQVNFTDRDINFHGGRHHDNVVTVAVSERDPDADNMSSVVSYNTEGERWGAPTDADANSIVFDRALGSKRPDEITGDDDGAWLDGRGADDILHGGAGPDTLIGGKGDDALDGGGGADRAVFAGDREDFDIEVESDGTLEVDGPDGRDLLRNVEWLRFDDQTVPVSEFGTASEAKPFQPG